MRAFVILPLLVLQFFAQTMTVRANVGAAIPYGPPYTPTKCNGNSQDQFPPGNMFAAVSLSLWDNGAACGRKYRVTCLSGSSRPCKSGTIDVQVVDLCRDNPCPASLLLSRNAFSVISSNSNERINVEYIEI
ncbi:uncharacterized protein A4U43_C06F10120 [Asparagus officinalis]|uniref:Expansin-like EG45 domain-containing protein n=1 Tax=Asparagus officinalis TaxID=4686 RepID=A0A5P1EKT5_ASPOF|nr:EG45-like domain containing protein 2 [Asparagus officinalis]ONK66608.1 uncharacterized protein A4U43_C06F10120 [Asparagus officinalis]